ncbi:MAG TPA: hypothetical protein DIT04_08125 [Dysgonomonas sp.]|nr:hypothetical protein [Dysgonomonas sp.]
MKGKLGILMVVFCVISFFLYRQGEKKDKDTPNPNVERIWQGTVIDADTETPIAGVMIAIQGENHKWSSNGQGEYAAYAKGSQELVFRHNHYKTAVVAAKDAKTVKMEALTQSDIERINQTFSNE